jgi:hypothetical protein
LQLDKKISQITTKTLNDLAMKIDFTDDTPKEAKIYVKNAYKKAVEINNIHLKIRLKYLDNFIDK